MLSQTAAVVLLALLCWIPDKGNGLVYPIGVISLADGVTGRVEIVSNLSTSAMGSVSGLFVAEDPFSIDLEDCRYAALDAPGFYLYSCDFPMLNTEANLDVPLGNKADIALQISSDDTSHFNITFGEIYHLNNNTNYNAINVLGGSGCAYSDFTKNAKEKLTQQEISRLGLWTRFGLEVSCGKSVPSFSAIAPLTIGIIVGVAGVFIVVYLVLYERYTETTKKRMPMTRHKKHSYQVFLPLNV